ncbi:MAG: TIGR00730 family Rossman fold protein [Planctomycetota bacterium]|nr:TIGR00730 family Rossman fold protein [Planctomycetota bacterium]
MNAITVFCSSSTFLDPEFHEPAVIVGRELAQRGISLVYGGGGIGLMVEIARACRDHGGRVVGVITQTLLDKEQGWDECDELIVVDTMRQRKQTMGERGEAFLILPGGVGTYEEFFEALAARLVGEHTKPIGIVNTAGYFDPLLDMLAHGIEHRFIKPAVRQLVHIDADPVAVIDAVCADPRAPIDDERYLPMGRGEA